ncbi:MAG: hypothetical protein ACYTEL_25680, partial [Planctomycetota bacterium]
SLIRLICALGDADFNRLRRGVGVGQSVLQVRVGIGPVCSRAAADSIGIDINGFCTGPSGNYQ